MPVQHLFSQIITGVTIIYKLREWFWQTVALNRPSVVDSRSIPSQRKRKEEKKEAKGKEVEEQEEEDGEEREKWRE